MKIEGNELEKAAKEQFHKGNRAEGSACRRNLHHNSGKNIGKGSLPLPEGLQIPRQLQRVRGYPHEPIRSMCPIACGRC